MDLMAISNTLKNLSDQQLAQIPHTSPEVPPFVYVAEMQRRQEMRKEFQQQQAQQAQPGQSKTVVQELLQNLSRPQQGPPQGGPPPMMGAPPQGIAALGRPPGMAAGGFVGFAVGGPMPDDGGDAEPMPQQAQAAAAPQIGMLPVTPDEIAKMYPGMSIEQAFKIAQGMRGQDYMGPIAAELAQQSAAAKNAKPNMWQALAQAGFSMAAEPTKNFGRAVGVGGLAGLGNIQEQKDRQQAQNAQTMANRINVAKAQSADDEKIGSLADAVFRNQNARMNTIIETGQANQRKNDGNILAKYAQAEKEADPSISDAEAYKRANLKYQTDQSKVISTQDRLKAGLDDIPKQVARAQANSIGAKYGIAPDERGFPQISKFPQQALNELNESMMRVNPNEWTIAVMKNKDPKTGITNWSNVWKDALQYKATKAPTGGAGPGAPAAPAFDPSQFGLTPVK